MILDPSLRLEATLNATASSDGPEFHVDYVTWNQDGGLSRPATTRGSISLGGVVMLTFPADGLIYEPVRISIYNKNNTDLAPLVRTNNSVTTKLIIQRSLSSGAGIHFEKGAGWYVV